MAITKLPPNVIHLGGEVTEVSDIAASEAITPGMLIERFYNAGVVRFRKSTNTNGAGVIFAKDQSMLNKGVDDAYAANDLVEAAVGRPGTTFWALVASDASIDEGALLSDAGNGLLKAFNTLAVARALETVTGGVAAANARIRVEVV